MFPSANVLFSVLSLLQATPDVRADSLSIPILRSDICKVTYPTGKTIWATNKPKVVKW